MEMVRYFVDVFLHLDKHLSEMIQNFGVWIYLILFLIIFAETGFVVTPFLPGDSLLFAVGMFAALGELNILGVFVLLCFAAIIGDSVNYSIGKAIGPKIFKQQNTKFFKKEHLEMTQKFYEKHGAKTIVLARFFPIIRTFAPFVAGIGSMSYIKFITYNIVGGVAWVACFVFAGYLFGNIPVIKKNFTLVTYIIIIVSLLPLIIKAVQHKFKK